VDLNGSAFKAEGGHPGREQRVTHCAHQVPFPTKRLTQHNVGVDHALVARVQVVLHVRR